MIAVAPAPSTEYVVEGAIYQSDHLQMIRDVAAEHIAALCTDHHCTPMPPVIVVHYFPDRRPSVHCGSCGAFIEQPPEKPDPQVWLKDGEIIGFVAEHRHHARDRVFKLDELPPGVPIDRLASVPALSPATILTLSGGAPAEQRIEIKIDRQPTEQPKSLTLVGFGEEAPY